MSWILNNILNQKGSPAIYTDTLANRPAAGYTGRLFVASDTFAWYRDNGIGWDLIGGPGSGTITGTLTAGRVAYATGSNTIATSANLLFDGTTLTTVNDAVVNGITIGRGNNNQVLNTVIGAAALANNISGTRNTAIGVASLNANTTGIDNVAVGTALTSLITGSENVSIGVESGSYAGLGFGTLVTNTSQSVYIGRYARASAASGNTNEIVVGYDALGNGSNTVTIGNTSIVNTYLQGAVNFSTGVITKTGSGIALSIIDSANGNALNIDKTGSGFAINVSNGTSSLKDILSGVDPNLLGSYRAIGFGSLANGNNKIYAPIDNSFGIYISAATAKGVTFLVNGGDVGMTLTDTKRLIINSVTDNLVDTLQVNGSAIINGGLILDDNVNGRITFENNMSENVIFSTTSFFGSYKSIGIKTNISGYGLIIDNLNNIIIGNSIQTGAPSGGTAAAWKLGSYNATSLSVTSGYIEIDIAGVAYKLALVN